MKFYGYFIFLSTLVSLTASADFCTDPYLTICGKPFSDPDPIYEKPYQEGVILPALFKAKPSLKTLDQKELLSKIDEPDKLLTETEYTEFVKEIDHILIPDRKALQDSFGKIRAAISQVVDENPYLTSGQKQDAQKQLLAAPFLTASEIVAQFGEAAFKDTCFSDGSNLGGDLIPSFPWGTSDGPPVTYLCPGLLDYKLQVSKLRLGDAAALVRTLVQPIAHELAHSVQPIEEIGPIYEAWKKLMLEPQNGALNVHWGFYEETNADFIAVEALAKLESAAKPPEDIQKDIEQTFIFLCGNQGDVSHTNGLFRINRILGDNQAIRELYSCPKK
jgi:hypothetical protein